MLRKYAQMLLDPAPGAVADPASGGAAPPAPVAPAAGAAAPPADKPEDLPGLQAFASAHLAEPVDEGKVKKDIEAAKGKKPAAAAAAAKPPPKKTPPKPKPAAVAPPAPTLTADQIAEAAARGVATVMKPDAGRAAEPKAIDLLPEEERDRVEVLQHMETMYGDRYKGLADRYTKAYSESMRKLRDYAQEWEKNNPGKRFDVDDPEHEEFMETNSVEEPWQDVHFHKAAGALGAKTITDERLKETNAKLEEINHDQRLRDAEVSAASLQIQGASTFWNGMGDDYKDVIGPNGVDAAKLAEVQKKDPEAYSIIVNTANGLKFETAELHRLFTVKGYSAMDKPPPTSDPNYANKMATYNAQRNLIDFAMRMEQDVLADEPANQLNEFGQQFVGRMAYNKLSPDQRAHYWTFGETDLVLMRAAHLSQNTKNVLTEREKQHRAYALSKGWITEDSTATASQPDVGKTPEQVLAEAAAAAEKPISPEAAGQSRLAATAKAGRNGAEDGLSFWARRHLNVA